MLFANPCFWYKGFCFVLFANPCFWYKGFCFVLFANPCFWYKGFCFRAFLLTICHQRQRDGVKQCPPRRAINKYIEVSLYHYEGGEFVLHLMRNVKLSKRFLLSFIFHQCTLFSPRRCCLPWSGLSK